MFLNELLLKTIREYQCDEDLFNFISESLTVLDEHQSNEVNFHLKFLLELSLHLGFYPNGQYSESFPYFDLYEGVFTSEQSLHKAVIGPDLSPRFSELIQLSISECDKVKLSNQERRALLSLLVDYYKIHIDKFDGLQSKEVLEAVLN
jgi:DNA repair protein RecO (recombination protein O)